MIQIQPDRDITTGTANVATDTFCGTGADYFHNGISPESNLCIIKVTVMKAKGLIDDVVFYPRVKEKESTGFCFTYWEQW